MVIVPQTCHAGMGKWKTYNVFTKLFIYIVQGSLYYKLALNNIDLIKMNYMPLNEIISLLKSDLDVTSVIKTNERMCHYTSFKIGGVADILVSPSNLADLVKVVKIARKMKVSLKILGNGTNLLVSDDGVRSIVLDCKRALDTLEFKGKRVIVGAGCTLERLSNEAADRKLSGVELAVGIPGSVGGALIMNAGAHEYNIGNIVENVTVLDINGHIFQMSKNDLCFNYRHSNLKDTNFVILNTELLLANGKKQKLLKIMNDELENRIKKFPLDYPNAGSIFKRPKEGYPGKWIEMAGCKGMCIGDAEVSTKHANFIINKGAAKASDVIMLINNIRNIVHNKFKVSLDCEIIFWGT